VAFTQEERAEIRMYAGWSGRFLQFDDAMEQAMLAIEAVPAGAAQIRGFLVQLRRIDAALVASESRLKASEVGSIVLNANEQDQLRARGCEFVGRMCRALGIEARDSPFSTSLPTDRASAIGMVGGGGYQLQG
jgi:hypothetical protein